jgi:hypothetical protein
MAMTTASAFWSKISTSALDAAPENGDASIPLAIRHALETLKPLD